MVSLVNKLLFLIALCVTITNWCCIKLSRGCNNESRLEINSVEWIKHLNTNAMTRGTVRFPILTFISCYSRVTQLLPCDPIAPV